MMKKSVSPKDRHINGQNRGRFMSDTMSPFANKKNIGTHMLAEKSVNIGFESLAVQEIETRDELLRIESEAPKDFRLKDVLPFNLGVTVPRNFRHLSKQNVET